MAKNSKTLQLRKNLLKNLQNGLLRPGDMLLSENALCETYNLTRPTVRSVLAELCAMGLLEKRPGIGTFVKDPSAQSTGSARNICIGTHFLYEETTYFSRPIISGALESPYAKNCTFVQFSQKPDKVSDYDSMEALMVNTLKEDVLHRFRKAGKPIIKIAKTSPDADIAYVSINNQYEACRGTDLLIRYGHEKIAVIGACSDASIHEAAAARTQGYFNALMQNGLPPPGKNNMFPCDRLDHLRREEFFSFLKQSDFTGIFFTTGVAFLNTSPFLMEYFGKSFYDLKLLIFDDLSKMCLFREMPATFIRIPLKEFGMMAVEYLYRKTLDPSYPVLRTNLRCTMVLT